MVGDDRAGGHPGGTPHPRSTRMIARRGHTGVSAPFRAGYVTTCTARGTRRLDVRATHGHAADLATCRSMNVATPPVARCVINMSDAPSDDASTWAPSPGRPTMPVDAVPRASRLPDPWRAAPGVRSVGNQADSGRATDKVSNRSVNELGCPHSVPPASDRRGLLCRIAADVVARGAQCIDAVGALADAWSVIGISSTSGTPTGPEASHTSR